MPILTFSAITTNKVGGTMSTKKSKEKSDKTYSYEEYRKQFYPKDDFLTSRLPQDSRTLGLDLAQKALKKIREQVGQM
jgi:hypothetical protein